MEGFVKFPNWLVRDQRFSAIEKIIWVVISSYKTAFPSQPTIAAQLGCSRDTVARHLSSMADKGLVCIKERPGRTALYTPAETQDEIAIFTTLRKTRQVNNGNPPQNPAPPSAKPGTSQTYYPESDSQTKLIRDGIFQFSRIGTEPEPSKTAAQQIAELLAAGLGTTPRNA